MTYSCVFSTNPVVLADGSTGECRTITKPAGVSLYSTHCNRTGYLVPKSKLAAGASVQVYLGVGYLPSTCPALNRECWVYAR